MRYIHFDGVGKRIRERLIARGFVTKTGAADVAGFIKKKHYDPRSFYPWVNKDRTPTGANLIKLCEDLDEQAHYLLMGIRVPKPTPGMSLTGYMTVLMKDAKERDKKEKKTKRRKPAPIRGGSSAENPLPVDQSSRLKKKHTKGGVSGGIDATLCQLRGWTMARCLRSLIPAAAHGTRRLAA